MTTRKILLFMLFSVFGVGFVVVCGSHFSGEGLHCPLSSTLFLHLLPLYPLSQSPIHPYTQAITPPSISISISQLHLLTRVSNQTHSAASSHLSSSYPPSSSSQQATQPTDPPPKVSPRPCQKALYNSARGGKRLLRSAGSGDGLYTRGGIRLSRRYTT